MISSIVIGVGGLTIVVHRMVVIDLVRVNGVGIVQESKLVVLEMDVRVLAARVIVLIERRAWDSCRR